MTDVQLDTYSSTGGASKTWVLTAWRSLLPLPAYYEALGTLQRNRVRYVHSTWGYHPIAQGTAFWEAKMGINHADHAQRDLETTESLTSKMSTMEVAGTSGVSLTARAVSLLPKSQVRFSSSTKDWFHIWHFSWLSNHQSLSKTSDRQRDILLLNHFFD